MKNVCVDECVCVCVCCYKLKLICYCNHEIVHGRLNYRHVCMCVYGFYACFFYFNGD